MLTSVKKKKEEKKEAEIQHPKQYTNEREQSSSHCYKILEEKKLLSTCKFTYFYVQDHILFITIKH